MHSRIFVVSFEPEADLDAFNEDVIYEQMGGAADYVKALSTSVSKIKENVHFWLGRENIKPEHEKGKVILPFQLLRNRAHEHWVKRCGEIQEKLFIFKNNLELGEPLSMDHWKLLMAVENKHGIYVIPVEEGYPMTEDTWSIEVVLNPDNADEEKLYVHQVFDYHF